MHRSWLLWFGTDACATRDVCRVALLLFGLVQYGNGFRRTRLRTGNTGERLRKFLFLGAVGGLVVVDVAEANNPGMFKKQPITVSVTPGCLNMPGGVPQNGSVALTTVMQKK